MATQGQEKQHDKEELLRYNDILSMRGGTNQDEIVPQNYKQKKESASGGSDASPTTAVEDNEEPSGGTSTMVMPSNQEEEELVANNEDTEQEDEDLQNWTREELLEKATQLKQEGKQLHDSGHWLDAANTFHHSCQLLQSYSAFPTFTTTATKKKKQEKKFDNDITSLYFTCQLHEALCRLKGCQHDECIEICTKLLDHVKQLDQSSFTFSFSALVARAHHRRAKAYFHHYQTTTTSESSDSDNALEHSVQDAKAAALLGDRKAVALYGKLMRLQHGEGMETATNLLGHEEEQQQSTTNPLLEELLAGKNPFLTSSGSKDETPSSLFDFMSSSSSSSQSSSSSSSSLLGDLPPSLLGQGGTGGSLAKSLLQSLTKRLETDSEKISSALQSTSVPQVQSLAQLFGIALSDAHAQSLVSFCHCVTASKIKGTVKWGRRIWYTGGVMRKCFRIMDKYKTLILLYFTYVWIQCALKQPLLSPQKAARLAAKAAARAAK